MEVVVWVVVAYRGLCWDLSFSDVCEILGSPYLGEVLPNFR
ncbi:hypothetical protein RchiOBHm_Chr0c31g0501271 [Rosa chinensis]|uniref:Uncharacterized protein n=1 Tax=Rosa chinensis TaxID=74649 RepID=A0A2P6SQB1_ROSCH|nr:hypothetical protein RchiOBHm_Chr0c31g0501271 [Rosa chinensis]